jgi:DHA3 family macrolide efflux protein-like MFS transporter
MRRPRVFPVATAPNFATGEENRLKPTDALKFPAFRDLWLGQAISQFGDACYYVIFMFMVKKATGSDAMVGFVGALEALPFLLFGPYAGVLADRMDRKKIMLLSDLVSGGALVVFAIVLTSMNNPPPWLMMTMAFSLSTFRCFFTPAKSAAIPSVVPPEYLVRANALSMTAQNLMPMLGLAIAAGVAGQLYDLSPKAFYFWMITINAASFFVSAVYIARLPKLMSDRKDSRPMKAMEDFRIGMGFIRKRRDISVYIAMLTVFRLMVSPFFVVYMAVNDRWFDGKPGTVAWLEFAFFLGMVISSWKATSFQPKKPGQSFALFLAVVGVTVAAMAWSQNFWLFCFWNFVAGLAVPLADIPIMTYMQISIPDEFRGRVNSVLSMIATGAMTIGMAAGGSLLKQFGPETVFLIMGIGMAVACLGGLLDPVFRNIRMPSTDPPPDAVPART